MRPRVSRRPSRRRSRPAALTRAAVLSTVDGGRHWAIQKLGLPGGYLFSVACTDRLHVWLGGLRGPGGKGAVIMASSDGGATWKSQYTDDLPENGVLAIAFADAAHGWALTLYCQVLATTDGGAHWKEQKLPGPRPLMLESMACFDSSHCWIAGLGEGGACLFATADGGLTWRAARTPGSLIDVPSILCLGAHQLCLVGVGSQRGTGVYVSNDGGLTWGASSGPVLDGVNAMAAGGSRVVWTVGDRLIAVSTNGGVTWARPPAARSLSSTLHDVACPPW